MKKYTLAVSVLALLSLTGCASQAQIEEQNKQLAAINVALTKIQENQLKGLEFQTYQGALQIQSNNVQKQAYQMQLQDKPPVISMRAVTVDGERVTLVDSKQVASGKTVSCQERVANVSTKPNSLGGKTTEVTKATDCHTQ